MPELPLPAVTSVRKQFGLIFGPQGALGHSELAQHVGPAFPGVFLGRLVSSAWKLCVTNQSPRWLDRQGGTESTSCPTGAPSA